MRFVCESCRAQYMINDEKVGPKGVKVRCRKCGYVILVKRPDAHAKSPVPSVAADPDDALATQILQSPLSSPGSSQSMANDTMSDRTNPGMPADEKTQTQGPNALLGDAGDDEIGAVFDQVLNSGANSIPQASVGKGEDRTQQHASQRDQVGLGDDDNDDRMSTRVIDAESVRKLAEEMGDQGGEAPSAPKEKSEKNGHHAETEVPQTDWFAAIDEKQTGPLTLEKMKEHWDRGELGPDSLCWRAGFTDWVPLSDVAQLASVLAPRPASKPIVVSAGASVPAVVSVPFESAFSAGGVTKSVRGEVQVPMAAAAPEDTGSWKPSAANALASLVQDEMAALSKPAPKLADEPPGPSDVSVGLLDLPPPEEKPRANGRSNGHAGASVDHPQREAAAPRSRGAAPANPYVATPGATYSSPGVTQYRPPNNRNLLIVIGIAGAVIVLMLFGLVIWLANKQGQIPQQVVVNQPVPAPAPIAAAAPVPVQPAPAPQPTAPVQPAPTAAPVAPPGTAVAAAPAAAAQPAPPVSGQPVPPKQLQPTPTRLPPAHSGGSSPGTGARAAAAEKPAPVEKEEHKKSSPKEEEDEFSKAFGPGDKNTPKSAEPTKRPTTGPYIPPEPGSASGVVKDSLGQSDILDVVMGNKTALAKCVQEMHSKEPGVTGKLVMKWAIGTNGKVSNVSVQSEEFKSTYLAQCVGGLIKSWSFPKSKTAPDPVVFPFKF
jgi:predicted Zn finger-like uncharacterized protein